MISAQNMRLQDESCDSFPASIIDTLRSKDEVPLNFGVRGIGLKHEAVSLASHTYCDESLVYWHKDNMTDSTSEGPYNYESSGGSPSSIHIVLNSIVQDERAGDNRRELGLASKDREEDIDADSDTRDFEKEIGQDIEKEIGGMRDIDTRQETGDILKGLGDIGNVGIRNDMKEESGIKSPDTLGFRDDIKSKAVDTEFSNVPYVMYRNQYNMTIADQDSMWSCGENIVTDWSSPGFEQSTATPLYVDNNPGRHDADIYRFNTKSVDLEYLLSSSDVARQAFIEMLRNLKATVDPKSLSSVQLTELLWYYLMSKDAKEKREQEAMLSARFDETLRGVEQRMCESSSQYAECVPTRCYREGAGNDMRGFHVSSMLKHSPEQQMNVLPMSPTDSNFLEFSTKETMASGLYNNEYPYSTLASSYVSQVQEIGDNRCRNPSYCLGRYAEEDSLGYVMSSFGRYNMMNRESERRERLLFEQYRKNLDGLLSRSDTEIPADIIQNLNQHKKVYTDDRDRMVYVSWIPKKGRAFNAADKRKMELDLKQKLRGMGLIGLTKVLLFPPKGVHCKLIFESRQSAAEFMSKYGGENSSAETECWKADMCRLYDIDMHEKFDKTVVKIEWSQK